MEEESAYEKKLQILRKAVDQGAKLETLHSMDEFKFFLSWIAALRDRLGREIMKGNLLTNIREEDHAKGGYKYLSDVLDFADNLPKKAAKARTALKKIMDEEAKERGEETEQ